MYVRFVGLSLALVLVGAITPPAQAATGSVAQGAAAFEGGSPRLTIAATSLVLDPIRLEDITDKAVQPLAAEQRRVLAVGGHLVASGSIAVPPVRLTVTRQLHQVWRMQQPAGRLSANINVTARVESMAGPGAFASIDAPGTSLPVRVIAQTPRTVATDAQGQTLEGDVLLELDLRNLRAGGHYSGRLVISAEGT